MTHARAPEKTRSPKAPSETARTNRPNGRKFEPPAEFRGAAENGVAQAREAYAQAHAAGEKASAALGETYEAARQKNLAVTLRAVEIAKTNAEASFDFFSDYFRAKSLAEAIELQTAFGHKQLEAFSGQLKELYGLSQQAALEVGQSVRTAWENVAKIA